jgi:hypothetical protein
MAIGDRRALDQSGTIRIDIRRALALPCVGSASPPSATAFMSNTTSQQAPDLRSTRGHCDTTAIPLN